MIFKPPKKDRFVALNVILACLAGISAVGVAHAGSLHDAYVGYFFDKVSFLVGCL